jgi:anti-sigma regulatory factor (Ser/Thr protein kinase)
MNAIDYLWGPSWVLPQHLRAVRQARHAVRRQLTAWGLAVCCDTAELLVSEMVTNAVRHGRGAVRLRLGLSAGVVRCEVTDGAPAWPRQRPAAPGSSSVSETGRGLLIMEAMAERWGVCSTGGGKTVWCELAGSSAVAAAEVTVAA